MPSEMKIGFGFVTGIFGVAATSGGATLLLGEGAGVLVLGLLMLGITYAIAKAPNE